MSLLLLTCALKSNQLKKSQILIKISFLYASIWGGSTYDKVYFFYSDSFGQILIYLPFFLFLLLAAVEKKLTFSVPKKNPKKWQ